MKINKHIIAALSGAILVERPSENEPDAIYLASLLGQMGLALPAEVKGKISPECEKEIVESLTEWATETYGLGRKWLTVYDNPDLLLGKTDSELLMDQVSLYVDPSYITEIKDRDGEEDFWSINHYELKNTVKIWNSENLKNICKELCKSKIPLGKLGIEQLEWFIENPEYLLVENVGTKETLAYLIDNIQEPWGIINSTKDVLRYIELKSQGNHISLTTREKKKTLLLLEKYLSKKDGSLLLPEMNQDKETWVRVFRHTHPNPDKYPMINKQANLLFSKDKSWKKRSRYYKIHQIIKNGDALGAIEVMSKGEFVRSFDALLRKSNNPAHLISHLSSLDAPIKTLLELSYHYDLRNHIGKSRSYLNKLGVRVPIKKELEPIDEHWIKRVELAILINLRSQYRKQDSLEGKKFLIQGIDEKDVLSLSNRCEQGIEVVKNNTDRQQIEIPQTGLVRFFLQWHDKDGVNDLDLHAVGFTASGEPIQVGWNTGFKEGCITHSGDIREQKGDCAEYVTVNMDDVLGSTNIKYLLLVAHDYNCGSLGKSCPAWFGITKVQNLIDGNEWIPVKKDTSYRSEITIGTPYLRMAVVNMEEGWMKVLSEGYENNEDALIITPDSFLTYVIERFINLRTLIKLNIEARGGVLIKEPEPDSEYEIIDMDHPIIQNNLLG